MPFYLALWARQWAMLKQSELWMDPFAFKAYDNCDNKVSFYIPSGKLFLCRLANFPNASRRPHRSALNLINLKLLTR